MVAAEVQEVAQAHELPVVTDSWRYESAEELAPRETVTKQVDLFTVSGGFVDELQEVAVAASRDESRPVLCSVCVEPVGVGLRLVATDTYRLLLRDVDAEVAPDFTDPIIVPLYFLRKGWAEFVKSNGGKRRFPSYAKQVWTAEVTSEYKTCNRVVEVPTGDEGWGRVHYTLKTTEEPVRVELAKHTQVTVTIQTREPLTVEFYAISGQFVNYTKVIPQREGEGQLVVSADHLDKCLECVLPVACEDANRIILSVNDEGNVCVSARYEIDRCGGGQASATVGGDMTGRAIHIGASCQYLRDFLALCRGSVQVRYWGPYNSLDLYGTGGRYVLMPMQIV